MPTTATTTTTTTDYETSDAILAAPAVNAAHAAVDDHDPEGDFADALSSAVGPLMTLADLWAAVDSALTGYDAVQVFAPNDLEAQTEALARFRDTIREFGAAIRSSLREGQAVVVDQGRRAYTPAPWDRSGRGELRQVACFELIAGEAVRVKGEQEGTEVACDG